MRILKPTLAITTTVFVVSVLLIATASSRRVQVKQQQSEAPHFKNFPIVDFEAKEPIDPKVKLLGTQRLVNTPKSMLEKLTKNFTKFLGTQIGI